MCKDHVLRKYKVLYVGFRYLGQSLGNEKCCWDFRRGNNSAGASITERQLEQHLDCK